MLPTLIPQPQHIRVTGGEGSLDPKALQVTLLMPARSEPLVKAAEALFAGVACAKADDGLFRLHSASAVPGLPLPPASLEGYVLRAGEGSVSAISRGAAGLYYALVTLMQLCEGGAFPAVEIEDFPLFSMRSDYLDLRNIYPKFDNLMAFIAEMSQYKLNTLVVEWEDKIPFDTMRKLRHKTQAFTEDQLARLQQVCQEHFIELIPLQQAFGHLEYALKMPEYIHLRELPTTPGEMCPLREGSFELAAALIADTVALHPESRYLHLGCDEVWSLGQSDECKASGKTREQISIDFLNLIIAETCRLGKIPIIWHDMVGKAPYEDLAKLDSRAVVAIWLYSAETVNRTAPPLMDKLDKAGISYIICSAVRSSDGENGQNYPVVENRLRNIDAWISLAQQRQCYQLINTNWASTYALGSPYGLFETSRYTAFYAAERSWNPAADRQSYLRRFLALYHGVQNVVLYGGEEQRFDYYTVVPGLLGKVKKNLATAQLIDLMVRYQHCWSPAYIAFRAAMFPDSEVELSCLRERAVTGYRSLAKVEEELRVLAPTLLDADMAELFITSRMYPLSLFKRELEAVLGEGL